MKYRSKKDWWLVGLVWAAVLDPVCAGLLLVLLPGGSSVVGWELLRAGVVIGAVVVVLTYPLDYEVTSDLLIARCGVMRWKVPLAEIQQVYPTRNPASAPTWSLDRLRVDYRKAGERKSLLISPADKFEFMRDLAREVPGLELRGERVVRV